MGSFFLGENNWLIKIIEEGKEMARVHFHNKGLLYVLLPLSSLDESNSLANTMKQREHFKHESYLRQFRARVTTARSFRHFSAQYFFWAGMLTSAQDTQEMNRKDQARVSHRQKETFLSPKILLFSGLTGPHSEWNYKIWSFFKTQACTSVAFDFRWTASAIVLL